MADNQSPKATPRNNSNRYKRIVPQVLFEHLISTCLSISSRDTRVLDLADITETHGLLLEPIWHLSTTIYACQIQQGYHPAYHFRTTCLPAPRLTVETFLILTV